jgi:uncharacterized protein YjeT (DUF2065 family)
MNWELLGSAVALVLIIEGMTPLLLPQRLRRLVALIETLSDSQLRMMGAASMAGGALILLLIR